MSWSASVVCLVRGWGPARVLYRGEPAMKLAAPIRCRHCGRVVGSPDDPEFYTCRFTVTDPHMDRWSCGSCLTPGERRELIVGLGASSHNVLDLTEVVDLAATPDDIAAAAREAGLVVQEVLLLHQFVNISWRAQRIAVDRCRCN